MYSSFGSTTDGKNDIEVAPTTGNAVKQAYINGYGGTTTGTDNTVIGTKAGGWGSVTLSSDTQPTGAVGTDNTVIGTEAGMVMQTGASDNVIVGEEAGQAQSRLAGEDHHPPRRRILPQLEAHGPSIRAAADPRHVPRAA